MPRQSVDILTKQVLNKTASDGRLIAQRFDWTPEQLAGVIALLLSLFNQEFPDAKLAKIIAARLKT